MWFIVYGCGPYVMDVVHTFCGFGLYVYGCGIFVFMVVVYICMGFVYIL